MSLKTVEKMGKYTPLIPYAVGTVIVGGVILGGYFIYTKLTNLVPSLPDVPTWLTEGVEEIKADLTQGKETSKQITLTLKEARDKAIQEKNSAIWWNAVNVVQLEFQDPATKIKIEIWSAEMREYEHLWASEPEPNYIEIQHQQELQTLETDRQAALTEIAQAKAKAQAELAAEKARLDAQLELDRIAQEKATQLELLAREARESAQRREEARIRELELQYSRQQAEEMAAYERTQAILAAEEARAKETANMIALREAQLSGDKVAEYWALVGAGKQD